MKLLKILPLAAVLLFAGCSDLDVVNPNNPDRDRVLSDPADVESLISTSFRGYYNNAAQTNPNIPTSVMAENLTGGFFDFAVFDVSGIPRQVWDNSPLNTRGFVARAPWDRLYTVISNVNDGLLAIDGGLEIVGAGGTDNTPRARAFGKFVQGISHAYIALHNDQALIVDENTDLETLDPTGFLPYQEVIAAGLSQIDEAIAIAQANSFQIPNSPDWINGVALSNQELVQLANTFKARIIVYTPRSIEERDAVDWNQVLQLLDAGIQQDFGPTGLLGVWENNMARLTARVRVSTNPGDHVRMNYMAVGPGDVSGAFQNWFNADPDNRMPFRMDSPDRRIQGAAGPGARGDYFGYSQNNIWPSSRGTYRWSHYFFHRFGLEDDWNTGSQVMIAKAEIDLLKAEALIRTGRAADAVPLINATRVANGQLPPVTVDGPPAGANCVPKKFSSGACGSLWDALQHERNMELAVTEGAMMWWHARGVGTLQEGTLVHFPVNGQELENLGLPIYTFGGAGNPGSAPAPQYHRCPPGSTLARCGT
ncbi:hypothetical protein BH23GEM11_BH23GEM11_20140 [soil metagenome]